ncbi:hypothetical protein B566_EDAN013457 [Ephemera danica]|nr:hypothetical protein B566_EDAN013457 [Ephemera danica]
MEINHDSPYNGASDDEQEDVEMARQECIVSSELLPFLDQDSESLPMVDAKNIVSKFSFTQKLLPKEPESDEDGDLIVSRVNDIKHSVIYTEYSTSTPLDSVGLQVWRGALLLADWALHHADLLKNATVLELGSGTVLEFDFFNDEWSSELNDVASRTSIVLAADVIYDDILTEAFVKTLKRLLSTPPSKTVYMALEKRYVFTLADFDSVAPCFEHFLRCIDKPDFPWKLESISCDFPQYFNYQRTNELAMWKIVSNSN